MFRRKMSRRSSRRQFRAGAKRVHKKNAIGTIYQRGGVRL